MNLLRWNWILLCWEESDTGSAWKTVKGGKAGIRRAVKSGGRVIVSETVN